MSLEYEGGLMYYEDAIARGASFASFTLSDISTSFARLGLELGGRLCLVSECRACAFSPLNEPGSVPPSGQAYHGSLPARQLSHAGNYMQAGRLHRDSGDEKADGRACTEPLRCHTISSRLATFESS